MAADDDLRNSRTKFNRSYSEADLALFARYVEERQAVRPKPCHRGVRCWVIEGPPALGAIGGPTCLGCKGRPRIRWIEP